MSKRINESHNLENNVNTTSTTSKNDQIRATEYHTKIRATENHINLLIGCTSLLIDCINRLINAITQIMNCINRLIHTTNNRKLQSINRQCH